MYTLNRYAGNRRISTQKQAARAAGKGSLLFLDEIDCICPPREDAGDAERRVVRRDAEGDSGTDILQQNQVTTVSLDVRSNIPGLRWI